MLPQANQARKAIWDAVNPHTGLRRIDDAFPQALRETTRDQDMLIRFKNGSTWQVLGSDNYNAHVGSPPVGIIFSEYPLADPNAWSYLRPILAENDGWAMFIGTPRGRNHAARMYEHACTDSEWHAELLTVDDTRAIAPEVIETERRELRAERGEKEARAIIDQEYYCSFDAAIPGAYYAEHMHDLERQGRIGDYPWIEGKPVVTAWDIGFGDSTAIWFAQWTGTRWRIIDYVEGSGVGPDFFVGKLAQRPYQYEPAILPHDAGHGSAQTGTSYSQILAKMGVRNRVLPNVASKLPGIQAVRTMLRDVEFCANPRPEMGEDADGARMRMQRGLDCLRSYRRVWSEKNQSYADAPHHDWASNGADAFRYLAVGKIPPRDPRQSGVIQTRQSWNVF